MYTKLVALLVTGLALSGCCVSGSGCSGPVAAAPISWDGLGKAPTAGAESGEVKRPRQRTAINQEIIVRPDARRATEAKARYDDWTRLPNEDPEADAKLARQLKICRNC